MPLPTIASKRDRPAWCLAAALALVGCEEPGERARDSSDWCPIGQDCSDDGCPEGEDCSPQTPRGLYFGGAPLGGLGRSLSDTAVGGVQTITVLEGRYDSRRRFSEPFDARAESPLSVDEVGDSEVELAAASAGSGYLRIVDPDTGELFDRVVVSAQEIDRVEMTTAEYSDDVLLFADRSQTLVARFFAGDERLVDEGIEFAAGEPVKVEREGWDLVTVSDLVPGEIEVRVLTSAGDEHAFWYEVVDEIDAIEADPISNWYEPGDPIDVGEQVPICFDGKLGDRIVAGLDWAYEAEGPVDLLPEPLGAARCALLEGLEAGKAAFTASAGDQVYELELEVVEPPPARLVERLPVVERSPATAGARAHR